jgi:hypothetical protein
MQVAEVEELVDVINAEATPCDGQCVGYCFAHVVCCIHLDPEINGRFRKHPTSSYVWYSSIRDGNITALLAGGGACPPNREVDVLHFDQFESLGMVAEIVQPCRFFSVIAEHLVVVRCTVWVTVTSRRDRGAKTSRIGIPPDTDYVQLEEARHQRCQRRHYLR